jgi:hypothetical protein
LREIGDQVEGRFTSLPAALLKGLGPFLSLWIGHDGWRTLLDPRGEAHEVRVISDDQPVQWSRKFDGQAGRSLDFSTACESIGIVKAHRVAEETGIE